MSHRRGRGYDPAVVDALLADGERWLAEIGDDPCAAVLDAEPAPVLTIAADELDGALAAVADFADLKSPFFRGHSTWRRRARGRGRRGRGPVREDAAHGRSRRAGARRRTGRVSPAGSGIARARSAPSSGNGSDCTPISASGCCTAARFSHPSPTSPRATTSGPTAPATTVARRAISSPSAPELLAAADAYHAMVEDRPHRPALSPADAASQLLDEVDAGRFARAEVDAVLDAAGQASRPPRVARPAGLTEREVDVLRLIARGHANKQVAATLGISPKTVGHHVEHIYAKAGVTTRAGATLFAMEHGLLSP